MSGDDGGLRPMLRTRLRGVGQWTTIETGAVEPGVPDLNVCTRAGVEVWIECKAASAWAVRIRPAQVGWISTRVRMGGRVLIMTRRRTRTGDDELYVTDGGRVVQLREGGLRKTDHLLVCAGGPARWRWDALEAMLSAPTK